MSTITITLDPEAAALIRQLLAAIESLRNELVVTRKQNESPPPPRIGPFLGDEE
jgi:hypothetical protein